MQHLQGFLLFLRDKAVLALTVEGEFPHDHIAGLGHRSPGLFLLELG